jgi:hypothetical protein
LFCIALAATARPAAGAFFTSSPGPLSKAHAALDRRDQCSQCHGDEHRIDDDRCLRCHRPIAERRAAHRGVHGAAANVSLACRLCHAEHKGRGRELFGWQAVEPFDHGQLANFRLDGKHAEVRCLACHKQTTRSGSPTYLTAPSTCGGCHQSRHGALTDALAHCDRCHSTRDWKPLETLTFNHERDARFSLAGKHQTVACASCHKSKEARAPFVFRNPAWTTSCAACHANVHGASSLFGRMNCQSCHSAKAAFKETHFDHKATRFALVGAHRTVACAGCHKSDTPSAPKASCAGCHGDIHRGRFDKLGGDGCAVCHAPTSFKKIQFDHARNTRFVLTGAHQRARCGACHRGKPPTEFENFSSLVSAEAPGAVRVACMGCHRHENAHKKQFPNSRCLECHQSAGMVQSRADAGKVGHGPTTRFPLVDRHAGLTCTRCHPSGAFGATSMECGSCHEDRLHHGSLGPTCTRCHAGARDWAPTRFSHEQTRFPLRGKHRDAACAGCHPARDFAARPAGFAPACQSCHADTRHRGEFGADCARCHAVEGWPALHTGHDLPSLRFGGAHDRLPCARCHAGGRPLGGTGELCLTCHRADDIHHNALGPECGTCHTQRTFSDVRFDHARIGCELKGAHRFLPCVDCHKGGNFVALATECVACHRADAVRGARAPGAPPDHASQSTCLNCHNPHFWGPAARSGGSKESMCR